MIATEVKDIFPTRLWSSSFAAGPDRSVSVVIACVNFYNGNELGGLSFRLTWKEFHSPSGRLHHEHAATNHSPAFVPISHPDLKSFVGLQCFLKAHIFGEKASTSQLLWVLDSINDECMSIHHDCDSQKMSRRRSCFFRSYALDIGT